MKKMVSLVLVLFLLLPAAALGQEVVNVYNWFDYIDETVLVQFEEETGIHVNYINFTTNEDMMVKLDSDRGAFDVAFPSEYCVQRLINNGMLMELDFSKIPNFSHIRENLKNPSYDPNNAHSVPYMCGTLGILYNTEKVDEADVHTWSVMWNEKYKGQVLMMDSIRDTMGIALKYLGYSMNSNDYTQLNAAKDLLVAQKQNGFVMAYGLDEFKDKMVAGDGSLAMVYSGDAEYAIELNDKLAYSIPDEGSNIWVDCAVIPKDAKNVENAYKFLDFLCRPDIAQKNVEAIWYMSVNQDAIDMMGEDYSSLYVLNPTDEEVARCEYFNDLDSTWTTVYNTLWQEVKNAKQN